MDRSNPKVGTAKPLGHLFDRGLLREVVKVYASKESMNYEQAHEKLSKFRDGIPKTPYQDCIYCDHGLIRFDRKGYEMVAACICPLGKKWSDWKEKGGVRRIRAYTYFHSLDTARNGIGVQDTPHTVPTQEVKAEVSAKVTPPVYTQEELDSKGESYSDDEEYARSMRGEA